VSSEFVYVGTACMVVASCLNHPESVGEPNSYGRFGLRSLFKGFFGSLQGVNGIDATHMWYLLSFYFISLVFLFGESHSP
jgi:hypothetical protein